MTDTAGRTVKLPHISFPPFTVKYTVCTAAILALGFAFLVPPFQFNEIGRAHV